MCPHWNMFAIIIVEVLYIKIFIKILGHTFALYAIHF